MILLLASCWYELPENPAPSSEAFCELASSIDTGSTSDPENSVTLRCGWSNIEECGSDEHLTTVSEGAFDRVSELCVEASGHVVRDPTSCTSDSGATVTTYSYTCGQKVAPM